MDISIDNMTEEMLTKGFLEGRWLYDSDDYGEALNVLLSLIEKNRSFNVILTLINGGADYSKIAGVWLAAMIGQDAKTIFSEIKHLIHSKNGKVRYEMVECYLECADAGESVIDLAKCIEDDDSVIRMRALDYLQYLSEQQIMVGYDFAYKINDPYYKAFSILKSQLDKNLKYKEIEEGITGKDAILKKFMFIAALKEKFKKEDLYDLSRLSSNKEIVRYFESFVKF